MIRRLPIALLPVLLAAGCASTTDLDVTRAQIVQQQQRLSQIETKISNDKLLDMINQVGSLQAEVAKLKGDVEVLNYNLQTTQKRQNDLYNDLDQRLTPLEGKTAATPAPGADSAARTDDGEAAAAPTTALLIAPLAEFWIIPLLRTEEGLRAWEPLLGTGHNRGIALILFVSGIACAASKSNA